MIFDIVSTVLLAALFFYLGAGFGFRRGVRNEIEYRQQPLSRAHLFRPKFVDRLIGWWV